MKDHQLENNQYIDDEIDLFELWDGLVQEKTTILVTVFLSLLSSLVYVFGVDDIYEASVKMQVQQVQQVQLGDEAKPYLSIEPANKTAEILNGIAPANLSEIKKVDGVLLVTSRGTNKSKIIDQVKNTVALVEQRHQKIYEALVNSGGVKSILPTEMVGSISVTDKPVSPKPKLILAVAGVLGLMLGVFIALIRRAVKNRKQ
ncbi:hypothetical protein THMIRHAM_05000 [Thiomicrorhabdus immobilis]|uniref:Polysaccharide chain length determinant N-terminal domain-containing protein n=1 Tax=Thiomicrorhabdus immobilis TaxID=2791037 RepID=A0ABM7MBG6_9GAMM|nr:Wzz/FepE/Etk N-terminal domain-containing protein [Thiomicrorhabdus immobilis]BCN92715.1 hypothetical protein THMIRHAM_05000 [Thiomicrorhabdus immobilis]